METEEIEVKSFKEVHQELEMEHMLLQKNHDVQDFKNKSSFLKAVGFSNSIATRLYEAIADSTHIVKDINAKYHGQHKFILEPQLERICEKYNLYVRGLHDFIADIPEKNIKDIMNFKVYVSDLPKNFQQLFKEQESKSAVGYFNGSEKAKITLEELGKLEEAIIVRYSIYTPTLQIAAVKTMFSSEAFTQSTARIINPRPERAPRFRVNLDPIVLCNTQHNGRLIVTAWGDEANDELVLNANHN